MVTQPQGWVFNGDGRSYQAASVVKSTFDAFGQATQLEALVDKGADAASDVWATTTRYYDRRGQLTAFVDPLGYVTTQGYDAAGNVTSRTEYANPTTDRTRLVLPAVSDDDRTVTSLYDRSNRKLSDTRENIEFSVAPDGTSLRGDVKTSFDYDAVGNLTKTTQELGTADGASLVTYSYFDALGRTTAVAAPTIDGVAEGTTLTPLTVFARDAFGNVLVKTEYANGAVSADASGFAAGAASADDRVTVTKYDAQGHAVQMTDANGVSRFMSYDQGGRVAKQWQGITSDDGFMEGVFAHTLFTVFQYDALGRQTAVITPGSTSVVRDRQGVDDGNLIDDDIVIVNPEIDRDAHDVDGLQRLRRDGGARHGADRLHSGRLGVLRVRQRGASLAHQLRRRQRQGHALRPDGQPDGAHHERRQRGGHDERAGPLGGRQRAGAGRAGRRRAAPDRQQARPPRPRRTADAGFPAGRVRSERQRGLPAGHLPDLQSLGERPHAE